MPKCNKEGRDGKEFENRAKLYNHKMKRTYESKV